MMDNSPLRTCVLEFSEEEEHYVVQGVTQPLTMSGREQELSVGSNIQALQHIAKNKEPSTAHMT